MSVSSLWQEFKTFAFKGNMIDLAIAVIIGGAFGKVISSLVDHILMPLIAAIVPNSQGYEGLAFTINGSEIKYGMFLGALFNFLIVAIAIFIAVVKTLGALQRLAKAPPEPGEPTTKECPYCLSNIPLKASRCAHCTSEVTPA